MALNIEAKVKIDSLTSYIGMLQNMTGSEGVVLVQQDIFFKVEDGALKYREIQNINEGGELIHYSRDYSEFPFVSRYVRKKVEKEEIDRLKATCGIKSVVKKRRVLFMVDNARIHVDNVEHLGTFLEIELVLTSEKQINQGRKTVLKLFERLDLQFQDILYTSYENMLERMYKGGTNIN